MRVVQTIPLPTDVTAADGLDWSEDNHLAAVTNRGVLVYEPLPDPSCRSTQINFHRQLIPNENDIDNPYLHDVGVDENVLLEELPPSEHSAIVSLRQKCPLPEMGKSAVRLVDRAKWSPRAWLPGSSPALITLTDDHWLRLLTYEDGRWTLGIDLSEVLHSHRKSCKWEGCQVSSDAVPDQNQDLAHSRLIDLRTRMSAMAITCFNWCSFKDGSSVLATASKSGDVSFWKFSSVEKGVTADIVLDLRLDLGKVSVLHAHTLENGACILFVGGVDGRLAVQSVKNTSGRLQVTELGYAWSKADNSRVKVVTVVREIRGVVRVAFAKGAYLVLVEVHLPSGRQQKLLTVKEKWAAQPRGSYIVDVQPLPDGSHVVARDKGRLQRLEVGERLADTRLADLETDQPLEIDVENFNCHGAKT